MIGVNSLHSAGRLRSRSLCSVRYGRDFRMMDPFRYPRTPRSRSLKPLVFPDLLGKAQDGQNHPQARKRKRACTTLLKMKSWQWTMMRILLILMSHQAMKRSCVSRSRSWASSEESPTPEK
ncbi:hypothetical protein cypCar_00027601 [Cyprinus carpio]|nr:hypothetical protein cypCar_00027601 [Cyprinus carpio]